MGKWWLPLWLGVALGALYAAAMVTGLAYTYFVNMLLWLLAGILPPYIFVIRKLPPLRAGALCGVGVGLAYHAVLFAWGGGYALSQQPQLHSAADARASIAAWSVPYTLLFAAVFAIWCWFAARAAAWITRHDVGISLNP